MKGKTISKIFVFLLIIILSISFVSAYKRLCLTYGQSIPSEENPRYTCWHDICQVCVTDNNYPTHPGYCNDIKGCELWGDAELDVDPPNLIINSPIQDYVYDSRKVLFDLTTDEPASIYYIDNINGRGSWKRICGSCNSYHRSLSFKDGLNDITIKAVDRNDNFIEVIKQFYVDSKEPKIRRTEPRRGFASGLFEVQFQEENPVSLFLNYGNNNIGYRSDELNINDDCYEDRRRYYCSTDADLEDYDNSEIEYWFNLTDMAGSFDISKVVDLDVDTTSPVINYFNYSIDRRRVEFLFDITEENFDEISYIDWNDRNPRWKRLCSRLKEGICEKRKSFSKSNHSLTVYIKDEAGNLIIEDVNFNVD